MKNKINNKILKKNLMFVLALLFFLLFIPLANATCIISYCSSSSVGCTKCNECTITRWCNGNTVYVKYEGYNLAAEKTSCTISGACGSGKYCSGGYCIACPCTSGACCSNGCDFDSTSTVCRAEATGTTCDVAENCLGTSASCPADSFKSSSTECRAAAAFCDLAESCTGTQAACPADSFKSSTVVCTTISPNAANHCDGSGNCVCNPSLENTAALCSDGLDNDCDSLIDCADTSSCPAGTTCETGKVCQSGTCVAADTTPPTVSVSGAPTTWQKTSATASVSCDDTSTGNSGCDSSSFKFYISPTELTSCSILPSNPIPPDYCVSCDDIHVCPHWGVKNEQCLPSCGGVGGNSCCIEGCASENQLLNPSYDCPYCCKASDAGTCGTVKTKYSYTFSSPQTITSHVWICATANDNKGNIGFSSPAEFKIDTSPPTVTSKIEPDKLEYYTDDIISINATATDLNGVKYVNISVDGVQQKVCPGSLTQTTLECNLDGRKYTKIKHTYQIISEDFVSNTGPYPENSFIINFDRTDTCDNNGGQFCEENYFCSLGGHFIDSSDKGTGNNARCCYPGVCTSTLLLPDCKTPWEAYDPAMSDCPSADIVDANVEYSYLKCCKTTPKVNQSVLGKGLTAYFSRQSSMFYQLTEGGQGDHLFCVAVYGTPGIINTSIKQGSTLINNCTKILSSNMTTCPFTADDTGTYTCNVVASDGKTATAELKVTKAGKDPTKMPFFGSFQFILTLVIIIIYLSVRKNYYRACNKKIKTSNIKCLYRCFNLFNVSASQRRK